MGIVLWLVSGAAAWASARIIPLSRPRGWIGELLVSVLAALAFGAVATALDFGGWREPDWRAGLFAVFGAFTAIGAFRLTISGNPGGSSS
jgi:uncharacterized membrane protein YeaQ/YmgE (transglycosylase-associated protein family)